MHNLDLSACLFGLSSIKDSPTLPTRYPSSLPSVKENKLYPAVTKPTMESSQNPCSIVVLTIRQLKIGNSIGFDCILYEQSMLKNFMAFNFDLSVIGGRSLT
mmetsp:Transcript_34288/g.60269  ORF Transcript_34288/g.60269 Transcript_34288/m.60269 type:complete len:102 (-) Transcript_34288:1124-1429(-)